MSARASAGGVKQRGAQAAATGPRPAGTDGSDHAFRQTIDERYQRSASARARLKAVSVVQLRLACVSLMWALAVPWALRKTAVPLPCATAATSLFAAFAGAGAAEATSVAALEKFAKVARSALYVVRRALSTWSRRPLLTPCVTPLRCAQAGLAFVLPRYAKVPGNPATLAFARWLAKKSALSGDAAEAACVAFDNALEASLALLPLMQWYYVAAVRAAIEYKRKSK